MIIPEGYHRDACGTGNSRRPGYTCWSLASSGRIAAERRRGTSGCCTSAQAERRPRTHACLWRSNTGRHRHRPAQNISSEVSSHRVFCVSFYHKPRQCSSYSYDIVRILSLLIRLTDEAASHSYILYSLRVRSGEGLNSRDCGTLLSLILCCHRRRYTRLDTCTGTQL